MARKALKNAIPLTDLLKAAEEHESSEKLLHDSSGATFYATREAMGMNQVELARALKVTQPYVSQIENGVRTPSRQTIERLRALTEKARSGKES